jgi:hypothetical protein
MSLTFDSNAMTRSDAYKHILAMGLLALRDRAPQFNSSRLVEIEAEHLHNIPSLIDEDNIQRHLYYFNRERPAYIANLKELAIPEYADNVLRMYLAPWEALLNNLEDIARDVSPNKEEVEQAAP